jgi:hypothetical protein
LIRTAVDQVLDGPKTGRWSLDQLQKTEKTHIGTRIEILASAQLGLRPGMTQDAQLDGREFDIKWSLSSSWMVAPENIDELCVGIGGHGGFATFGVCIFVAYEEYLGSPNRDGKRPATPRSIGPFSTWLIRRTNLPRNFVEDMDPDVRNAVSRQSTAQAKIRTLAALMPRIPIPRSAITVLIPGKDDPLRRLRKDSHRHDPLGEMICLSARYDAERLRILGIHCPPDHFVFVHKNDLAPGG